MPCRSRRQVDQQRLCEVIETRERNGITEYYIHYVGRRQSGCECGWCGLKEGDLGNKKGEGGGLIGGKVVLISLMILHQPIYMT